MGKGSVAVDGGAADEVQVRVVDREEEGKSIVMACEERGDGSEPWIDSVGGNSGEYRVVGS